MKSLLTSVVAPLIVGIALSLFDHWPDDQHHNQK
ncbi:MAG: type I toxin-antitoxin system Fst family toxin [Lactobacillus sp.]|nr:type I toxin-antitoxin system Fst family toxin [Lactobacillus sp.]